MPKEFASLGETATSKPAGDGAALARRSWWPAAAAAGALALLGGVVLFSNRDGELTRGDFQKFGPLVVIAACICWRGVGYLRQVLRG
jgi:hypothetical protein